jgi:hypothetical protein
MKLHTFNRKFHYWAAIVVALPVLVIIGSGLLLQMKKQAAWVQLAVQVNLARNSNFSPGEQTSKGQFNEQNAFF